MVSVIITTHNRLELLKLAIDSVKNQSFQDYECIVVDDASTDGTHEYMKNLKLDKFRYLRISPEESKGGNHARNQGINYSTGEYVAFLDDDDQWMKDKLKLQVEFLDTHPDVGMVHCQLIKDYVAQGIQRKAVPDMSKRGDWSQKIFGEVLTVTSCMMVRRNILDAVQYFDENIGFWQEHDLCIRICQVTKVDFVKKYLVLLRCDKKDRYRLTNKFDGWVEAVKYQNRKYKKEIETLSQGMQRKRKLFIYREATMRLHTFKQRKKRRLYLRKIYEITHDKADYMNYLFNREIID